MPKHKKPNSNFVFPTGVKNAVSAAVAAATLEDYRINRFTFPGFPEVVAESVVDGMHVWIGAGGRKAGPLFIEAAQAIKIAKEFWAHGTYPDVLVKQAQDLLINLERLTAGWDTAGKASL